MNKKVEVQVGESSFLFGSTISALIGTIATVVGNNRLVGYEGEHFFFSNFKCRNNEN